VAGGQGAIDILSEDPARFSLVILDLTMPGMSGAATYDAIRRISPDVKVLLISGFSAEAQAQGLISAGAAVSSRSRSTRKCCRRRCGNSSRDHATSDRFPPSTGSATTRPSNN